MKKYSELTLEEKIELEKEKTKLKEPTTNLTKVKINYKKIKNLLWYLQDSEKERDEVLKNKNADEKEIRRAIRNYHKNIMYFVKYWNRNVFVDIQNR